MLFRSMIQRVFYGDLGLKPSSVTAPDLDAREHAALWPLVALFLLMGVGSPYWMRAIDTAGVRLAQAPAQVAPAAATSEPPYSIGATDTFSTKKIDAQKQIPAAQEAAK